MSRISILYVEDEPFLGKIVKESLESRNFSVTMVSDGRHAVETFRSVQPDICVLDVMLPHKDGYSIGSEIRKLNECIPIIFVTAKTQTEDLLKGFQSGGNDYIRKPFSMEELIVRIHNLLNIAHPRKTQPDNEPLILGKYTFLPARFELRFGDTVRKLSHRETTLLQMLAANTNAIVQRKDILLKLWGDDSFFNSRNLDVYIAKLRDYLKDDPSVEILTIKGIGYRVVRE